MTSVMTGVRTRVRLGFRFFWTGGACKSRITHHTSRVTEVWQGPLLLLQVRIVSNSATHCAQVEARNTSAPPSRPLRVFDPCGGAFVHTSAFRLTRDLSRWVTRAMFKRSDTFTQILVLIFSFKILLQPRPLFYDFPFSFLSQLNGKHNCQLNSEKTKMANIFKTCRI